MMVATVEFELLDGTDQVTSIVPVIGEVHSESTSSLLPLFERTGTTSWQAIKHLRYSRWSWNRV
jgi:hypothetical protein